ncbi:phosphatase PAP2 family protein [Defluviimonas sp. SAOS-178_SWC]|uniref:phosphatase PAP2 family protein n=1 Tax=Defluviimonas sp. SAOS-178_SWC TaxID=3121287 RepID=UPI0032221CB3
MKLFFRLTLIYMAISVSITALSRDVGIELAADAGIATLAFASLLRDAGSLAFPVIAIVPFVIGWRNFAANLDNIAYALLGTVIFQAAFSFVKSTIPFIVPFYADRYLADFDRWLHGGTDPWVFAHAWAPAIPIERLLNVYMTVWTLAAIGFIVAVAMTDRDRQRVVRFLVLFFLAWVFLGNVLAVAFSSVGPVFYDQLLGGDRFAALAAALAEPPFAGSQISTAQGYLWAAYSESGMALGSGISAFPSVHLGVATMTALYMGERSRWLILPGVAFVATILFMSVYTGYHYAVDGYFSILFMLGLWAMLRRVQNAEARWNWEGFSIRPRQLRTDP